MPKEKQPEFVVTDRRKFTSEGEVRPDAAPEEAAAPTTAEPAAEPVAAPVAQAVPASAPGPQLVTDKPPTTRNTGHVEQTFTDDPGAEPAPVPATAAERHAQSQEYSASNKKLEEILRERSGGRPQNFEMSFDKLTQSLYFTALMQLGMVAPEGEQPRADIIGARQTIDTLSLLEEKTKGNLTAAEQSALQQAIFDLRMAYVQLTNAITQTPPPKSPKGER
jgi:uncharacterized protein DUF1844